MNNYND
jgi:hypothetical protein